MQKSVANEFSIATHFRNVQTRMWPLIKICCANGRLCNSSKDAVMVKEDKDWLTEQQSDDNLFDRLPLEVNNEPTEQQKHVKPTLGTQLSYDK